jgi:hypothetical protein
MKSGFLTRMLLGCLLFVVAGCDVNEASSNRISLTEKNFQEKSAKSFQDPIEYVLRKLEHYDLVMIGEHHWTHEQPTFIQNLIKRCYETNAINVVFLEFGKFTDQGEIDAFMEFGKYDPKPVIDVLRNTYDFGWGYQEYFDIYKLIYEENRKRRASERIRLILVYGPPDDINIEKELYKCIENSEMQEKQKWSVVGWLRDAITDRDLFMAEVIDVHLFKPKLKGIYYAGCSHIRKDLRQKDNGRRYFSAGGILARKYPGRACCLTFHMKPRLWQNLSDFNHVEEFYKTYGKPFAVDTNDPLISHLKLKSDIAKKGVTLHEAIDGYIVLNRDKDYKPCAFIPGFYDDEFAKVVWDRLRKDKQRFERLPPELRKTPTGEELMKMMEQGLR